MFDRGLNMPRVLNTPGFQIYMVSEYASNSQYQRFEYSRILDILDI